MTEEHAGVIAREGGVLLLLEAVRRHSVDPLVVSNACAALGNLSLLGTDDTERGDRDKRERQ